MGIWLAIILYFVLVIILRIWIEYWWKPRRSEFHFTKQGIRGPKYQFFLGNMKELASLSMLASSTPMSLSHNILPRVLSFYHHWRKTYGATFVIWFGAKPRVAISDPVIIREIFTLTAGDYFEKVESPPLVKNVEGDGLLTLKGEKWAHHRRVIMPTFHLQNLKVMIPNMVSSMGKMLDEWTKMSSSSDDGKVEIEVSKWFQILAEDVITHTVFGSCYDKGRAIFQLQAQQMVHATQAYQKVFIPGYRFLPTKTNRLCWRLDKEIRISLMKLILERTESCTRQRMSGESRRPNDLLELMIHAGLKQTAATNPSSSSSMTSSSSSCSIITADDMVEECKTMLFAGKHTTANLMTWTTVLLAMHPHWQELAREEVFRVCGARDTPTKDDVDALKTLGMILNESLRLYPPAVAIIRQAKIDVQLQGGLMIPRGTELLIPILAIHHDPELWGSNVNEFNPHRFVRGVTHVANQPMAFLPFGLGSRRCIGQNLALLQTKLAIAMILQRFSFQLASNYQHAPTVQMLLCPQYGAPVIFQKFQTSDYRFITHTYIKEYKKIL